MRISRSGLPGWANLSLRVWLGTGSHPAPQCERRRDVSNADRQPGFQVDAADGHGNAFLPAKACEGQDYSHVAEARLELVERGGQPDTVCI